MAAVYGFSNKKHEHWQEPVKVKPEGCSKIDRILEQVFR
jgi:hypothetical protein